MGKDLTVSQLEQFNSTCASSMSIALDVLHRSIRFAIVGVETRTPAGFPLPFPSTLDRLPPQGP